MLAFDRCKRCVTIAQSWFGKNFESIVKRVAEKPSFKVEFDLAADRFDAIQSDIPVDSFPFGSGLTETSCLGSRTEVVFWFISLLEFHKMFNLEPKQIGCVAVPWPDESGIDIKGIFVKPDESQPPDSIRRVIFCYNRSWSKADSHIAAESRLRMNEVVEGFVWAQAEDAKKRPKDRIHASRR